jgi:hypothetical protein
MGHYDNDFARQRQVSAVHGVQRSDSRERWEDSSDSEQDEKAHDFSRKSESEEEKEELPFPVE